MVRAKNGLTMEVVYITLVRPHAVAMKMIRGPWFLKKFAGTWRFSQQAHETLVSFRYHFETPWPWLRFFLNSLISRVFHRNIRQRLQGLKQAAENTDILHRLREAQEDADTASVKR